MPVQAETVPGAGTPRPGRPGLRAPRRIAGLGATALDWAWQSRAWVAALLLLCLMGLLVAAISHAQRAREAAVVAEDSARRAQRMQSFVTQMLGGEQAPAPSDVQRSVDLHADQIAAQFAGDAAAQVELLGIAAGVQRALGDTPRYENLRLQQARVLGAQHEPANAGFIDALISDALLASGEAGEALLEQAGILIQGAELERDPVHARWWEARGEQQLATGASPPVTLEAWRQALALYEEVAPISQGHLRLRTRAGALQLASDPEAAAAHYQRALAVAGELRNPPRRLLVRDVYPGLARALSATGEYAQARAILGDGARLLATHGDDATALEYALAQHRQGVAQDWAPWLGRASLPGGDVAVSNLAERLLAQGQGDTAASWLQAHIAAREHADQEVPAAWQLLLAQAWIDAGETFAAGRVLAPLVGAQAEGRFPADLAPRLWLTEAELALSGRRAGSAGEPLTKLLAHTNGQASEIAVLGRLAKARQVDDAARLAQTTSAVMLLEHLRGPRDIRLGPIAWLAHAQALRAAGNAASARVWLKRSAQVLAQLPAEPASARMREAVGAEFALLASAVE